ncbi:MAG: electron transfer flavoprotein subunit beta/FixA family protein [Candidatus Heimdallarchaeota archaeon]|nr:electron transfer flavoprotein subunit beta/FixA family protein [Candidatus Heimdallarchaeota archaeon]
MKIVILVKQVPEADKVAVDLETGTLIREGIASILNPYCEYALDQAAKLKLEYPELNIEITAITMGPPQAKAVLYRCLELGADKGYLLSDRKFAGSDVWATSTALKEGVIHIEPDFDLILAGKQAIDGDTAQVPAETAEQLGIPQITYGIDVKINGKRIEVKRETETGYQVLSVRMPALVTMSKGSNIRRIPSMKQVLDSRNKTIGTVTADDMNIDENRIGLKASPTQVAKIFAPPAKTGGEIADGSEPKVAAQKLLDYLIENKFIKG